MKVVFAFIVIAILVGLGGVYEFSGKSNSEIETDQATVLALPQSVQVFTNQYACLPSIVT